MAQQEDDLVSAILVAISAKLADVYTSLPGKVVAVEDGGRKVAVSVQVTDPDGVNYPQVLGAAVVQPLAGAVGVGVPISVGTEGLLLCMMLDPGAWLAGRGVQTPARIRHALGHAMFLPGVGPSAPAAPSKPTIGTMGNTSHSLALGDNVAYWFDQLDTVIAGAAAGTPAGWAAFQAAWAAVRTPVLKAAKPIESTDAEVTSSV